MSIVKLNNAPSSQKTPAERVVRSSYFDADPDRGTTLITQLQKQMMDKAEQRNMAALNLVAQSFQELRNECSNMTAILEKIAKLQTHAVKAEKSTLSEIKEMNKGLRDSDRDFIKSQASIVQGGKKNSRKTQDHENQKFKIKDQFQINLLPNISQAEEENKVSNEIDKYIVPIASENNLIVKENLKQSELQKIEEVKVNIQSREQIIVIPIKTCENHQNTNELESIKETISVWVGKTYDTLIKQSFNGYFQREMQQSEAKVFFCQNLMLNFLELLDYLQKNHQIIWQQHKDELMELYEKKAQQALNFYLVKYPQKKKVFIDPSIRKAIRPCNYSQSPQFNIMINLDCDMRHEPSGNYFGAIKRFLNALISESWKHFPEFKSTMKEIFTFSKQTGEKYELDNLIGTKLREGTPLYTQDQIKRTGIQIKTPEVLRVIMKWIEQLQQIIQNPYDYFGERDDPFPNRNKAVVSFISNSTLNYTIAGQIAIQSTFFNDWQKENKKIITSACRKLSHYCKVALDSFKSIQPTEIKKTLPAYAVSQVVASSAISKLNKLIELINKSIVRIEKEVQDQDLQFIPFSVSDLLRCKCSGTVSEVIEVVKRLQSHNQLSIVRIKDRLNTGNQDFLINIKMKNCAVLCEIQVGFTQKSVDKKMEFLDHFNHFLYELARSEYGPLAESTLIASNLTLFNSFYDKVLEKVNTKKVTQKKNFISTSKEVDEIQIEGFKSLANTFSFLCSNCLMLRRAYHSFHKIFKREDMDQFICGSCAFESLKQQDKSTYLLGPVDGQFFKPIKDQQEIQLENTFIVIIPFSQDKQVLYLTNRSLGSDYSHIFYEFHKQVFYTIENVKELKRQRKIFLLQLKKDIQNRQINTEELIKEIDKNHNIQLSKLISRQQESPPSYFNESRKLKVAGQKVKIQKIAKCPNLMCLSGETIPYYLIIDAGSPEFNIEQIFETYQEKKKIQKVTKNINMTWNLGMLNISQEMLQRIKIQHNLKRLKLNDNQICSLNLFRSQSLQQLYINNNFIRKIKYFGYFPQLQILQISQNKLQSLENIGKYTQLRMITADMNSIKQINFSELPKSLQSLSLAGNLITEIDEKYQSSILLFINLESNQIRSANFEHISVPSLKSLNLSYNKLRLLVLPQKSLRSLTNLKASHNQNLKQIQFSQLQTLQYINLEECSLHYIDTASQNLIQLKASQNRLKGITFQHPCPNLSKLSLNCNYLKQLNLAPLGPIDNLRTLELSYNYLTSIRFTPPETNFKLELVSLIGNHWPIKFSPGIKRSERLAEFNVGGDSEGAGWVILKWALRGIEDVSDFIRFVNKKQKSHIFEDDRKFEEFVQAGDASGLQSLDQIQDYFAFPEMVKKYYGFNCEVGEIRNLIKETTGEYIVEASI